jgi:hypothetical protein
MGQRRHLLSGRWRGDWRRGWIERSIIVTIRKLFVLFHPLLAFDQFHRAIDAVRQPKVGACREDLPVL